MHFRLVPDDRYYLLYDLQIHKSAPIDSEKIKRQILQYYVKNLKTLWHTATYVYNSPLRCTLQHLADDIENS